MKAIIHFLLLLLFLTNCTTKTEQADLIIHHASIWTGDKSLPSTTALAVKGERILQVGSDEDILLLKGENTVIIDANGRMLVPGFIDSHVHFIIGGMNLASVQLRDAATKEEFISRIADFATESDGWITGGDWDHELWGGELPQKEWIDPYTATIPIALNRLDGHMILANSKAMELAGITKETSEVEGGEIVRDENGEPTGVFKDNAMHLIYGAVPNATPAQVNKAIHAAMNYVASMGVTSVHHMAGYIDDLEAAHANNELITRIYALTPLSQWKELKDKIDQQSRGDDWLKFGGLKGFVDGSLGSHTAAFKEPYSDKPDDKGFFITEKDSLRNWIVRADAAGLQVAVHAIGDEAISFLLDAYSDTEKVNGKKDRRFRIEHAQHIDPADYSRFAELGVIPSMQPYHAIDDGRWAERVIGPERIQSTYAFKSLIDAEASLALGSDWFVAPPSPMLGIYAAVTRRTLDNQNPDGWVPSQKISIEEALGAYTMGGAYASFDEDKKGSITAGKLADFVILSDNIFEIEAEKIKDVKVMKTFVGGKQVYTLE